MKLLPFINSAPNVTPSPFLTDYCRWADETASDKPYFYGKWSLKWVLSIITPDLKPSQITALAHHLVIELASINNPEEMVQYEAARLMAFRPWQNMLNHVKARAVDVTTLQQVKAGPFSIVINNTPDNLNSLIFRHTYADAVVSVNSETMAAGIALRVNSKINQLAGFKIYLQNKLNEAEPGWHHNPEKATYNNYGIRSNTPTTFTTESLSELFTNYFNN